MLVETKDEYQSCQKIREHVFIREQKVPWAIAVDSFQKDEIYIITNRNGTSGGTAQWRQTDLSVKFECFAVLKDYRGKGIEEMLVKFILNYLKHTDYIYLHAQEQIVTFYEKCGFKVVGDLFIEADIPHLKMIINETSKNKTKTNF